MREITLDTETTGLNPKGGDRLVEVACVELRDGLKTGKVFHTLVNPLRPIGAEVVRIHGITNEDVANAPRFEQIVDELIAFIGDSPVIIHNATFDMGFLDMEMALANRPLLNRAQIIDSLALAKKKFPGSPVSIDALCRRFRIPLAERSVHGALIDGQLLAEVYLHLNGGRQRTFEMNAGSKDASSVNLEAGPRAPVVVVAFQPRADLVEAHEAFMTRLFKKTDPATSTIRDTSLWATLAEPVSQA